MNQEVGRKLTWAGVPIAHEQTAFASNDPNDRPFSADAIDAGVLDHTWEAA